MLTDKLAAGCGFSRYIELRQMNDRVQRLEFCRQPLFIALRRQPKQRTRDKDQGPSALYQIHTVHYRSYSNTAVCSSQQEEALNVRILMARKRTTGVSTREP